MVTVKSGLILPASVWGVIGFGLKDQAPSMKTERINKPAGREEFVDAASRREFLRGGARYALLAGLGAVSAALVRRSGGQLAGQNCINQGICRGCGAFEGCGLPQALSAKQSQSRSSRRESAQTSTPERGVPAASASPPEPALTRTEVRAPEANHET